MLDAFRGPTAEEQVKSERRISADVAYEHGLINRTEHQSILQNVDMVLLAEPAEQPLYFSIKQKLTPVFERLEHIKSPRDVFSKNREPQSVTE